MFNVKGNQSSLILRIISCDIIHIHANVPSAGIVNWDTYLKDQTEIAIPGTSLMIFVMKYIIDFANENGFMGFFEHVELGTEKLELHVYEDGKFVPSDAASSPVEFADLKPAKEKKEKPEKVAKKAPKQVDLFASEEAVEDVDDNDSGEQGGEDDDLMMLNVY
jgi:hypothetical protein